MRKRLADPRPLTAERHKLAFRVFAFAIGAPIMWALTWAAGGSFVFGLIMGLLVPGLFALKIDEFFSEARRRL